MADLEPTLLIVAGFVLSALVAGLLSLVGLVIAEENRKSHFRREWAEEFSRDLSAYLAQVEQLLAGAEPDWDALSERHQRLLLRLGPEDARWRDRLRRRLRPSQAAPGPRRQLAATLESLHRSLRASGPERRAFEEAQRLAREITGEERRRARAGEPMFRFARAGVILLALAALAGAFWAFPRMARQLAGEPELEDVAVRRGSGAGTSHFGSMPPGPVGAGHGSGQPAPDAILELRAQLAELLRDRPAGAPIPPEAVNLLARLLERSLPHLEAPVEIARDLLHRFGGSFADELGSGAGERFWKLIDRLAEGDPEPGPGARPAPEPEPSWVVRFEFGGAALTPAGRRALEQVAAAARRVPERFVALTAHADRVGSAEANRRLAARRGAAVAAQLRQQGVATDRLVVTVFGEAEAPVPTADEEREPENRRVSVALL